jgi:hypothetical protein
VIINIIYDSSVSSAPAGFTAAVTDAVQFYEHAFTDPITITIDVGWNEINGTPITGNSAGRSQWLGIGTSYSQLRGAFLSDQRSADDATAYSTFPATDPTNGGTFVVSNDQARALGLTPSSANPDAWIGISDLGGTHTFTFDPNNRTVTGEIDAIGLIEHEISECLGRGESLGQYFGTNVYTLMDLFRYGSAGVRDLVPGPGYFSIDGSHLLTQFNDPTQGGDAGDWASGIHDSYSLGGNLGQMTPVTPTDLRLMDVLGYNRAPATTDDFNGDAVSDILFVNSTSGDIGFYGMQGSLTGWRDVAGYSTAYSVVGTGDFDGDFTSDILFRNSVTGDIGFYALSNGGTIGDSAAGTLVGWHDIGGSSTAYTVVGTGDFFGNGTSDILFRNNITGDVGFYAITNGANTGWHDIGGSSTAYSAIGIGDFLGNGTDDLLFRNNTTGDVGFYQISNGTLQGWHDLGGSSTAYTVVGIGDFLGSGTDDILFRNTSSGDVGFYQISNGSVQGWQDIGGSSTAYSVVAVGDYYGNGTSDILFRNNATGDTGYYAIANGALTGWHGIGSSSPAYQVVS